MFDKVFLGLLSITGSASAIILITILARLFLRKAPKKFSYALWAAVLFRLLCPFPLEAAWGAVPQSELEHIAGQKETYIFQAAPALQADGEDASGTMISLTAGYRAEHEQGVKWLALGKYVWVFGMAVMALYHAVSLFRLRRKLIVSVPLWDRVYLADYITSPFVLGLFHPNIYLPSSLLESERRHILLHERCHIQRLDHITRAAAFAALCIHWFNPLVWVAFVLSGRDMEMSCDEAVLKQLGADICPKYAASLLHLATGRSIMVGSPLAFGKGAIKVRIKNVMRWKKPSAWVSMAATAVCAVTIAVCAASPKAPVEEFSEQEESGVVLETDEAGREDEMVIPETGEVEQENEEPLYEAETQDFKFPFPASSEEAAALASKLLSRAFSYDAANVEPVIEDGGRYWILLYNGKDKINSDDPFYDDYHVEFAKGFPYPQTLYHCTSAHIDETDIALNEDFRFDERMLSQAIDVMKKVYGIDCSKVETHAYGHKCRVVIQFTVAEDCIFQVRFFYKDMKPSGVCFFRNSEEATDEVGAIRYFF